jgi:uncharacterized protein with PIN domain
MHRRCPSCGSLDVRRSNTRDRDEPPRTLLRSRYRCRKCSALFWVVSARTYRIVGIVLGVSLLTAAVLALLIAALGD